MARSRIEDCSYAAETANLTKNQILQQATSISLQANQAATVGSRAATVRQVLGFLRGYFKPFFVLYETLFRWGVVMVENVSSVAGASAMLSTRQVDTRAAPAKAGVSEMTANLKRCRIDCKALSEAVAKVQGVC